MKKLSILLAILTGGLSFSQQSLAAKAISGNFVSFENNVSYSINEECSISNPSNEFEGAHGSFSATQFANDFNVDAGQLFSISQLVFNAWVDIDGNVDAADIYFYEDTDGNGPGELIHNYEFLLPSLQTVLATGTSIQANEVIIDFDEPIDLEGGDSGKIYWVAIQIYTDSAQAYWETSTMFNSDNEDFLLDADTGTWVTFTSAVPTADPADGVFTLNGDCTTMAVSDVNAASQMAVYPNPATNVVNVSLKNSEVKEITVTSLSGQVVASSKTASVNVSALPAGVYVIKVTDTKGVVRTSKVVVK